MKSNRIMPLPRGEREIKKKGGKRQNPINCDKNMKIEGGVKHKGDHQENVDLNFELLKRLGIKERKKGTLKCTVSESHISAETSSHYPKTKEDVAKNFKRIHRSALFSDIMKPGVIESSEM